MIREIQLKDKEQWEKLYKDYANFYKVEMNDKILQTVWSWLHNKNHEIEGLVYEIEGSIVSFAHYRRMPSPLRGKDIGFLDDLFVDPNYRGQKIGEKMLNKLANSFHVTANTIFAEGHAGPEIIRVAAEQNADLVVVGTHGYTGWNRLALGSVSEYIVRHSPCAVLTIKPTENELYKTG